MARIRDPNRDKAKEIYLESSGQKPLKDIASELNKSDSQIRKWKNQDKWDEELKGNVTIKSNSNVTNEKVRKVTKGTKENVPKIELVENDDLTDKQRLFVGYYLECWNATQSYKKAYECDYETAKTNGNRLLTKAHIRDEIVRVRDELFADSLLTPQTLIKKYMDIAFMDISDFVKWNKNGTFMQLKPMTEVDGSLISELSNNEHGMKIKLADRMKALEKLEKYIGLMSEEDKARVALLKSKIPNTNTTDMNAQITALADLINNPAPERVMPDD